MQLWAEVRFVLADYCVGCYLRWCCVLSIFVFFLDCVSVCARARMVITAFLVHLLPFVYCDYFSTIPISVYAFSLFISGFVLTSQPFFLLLLHLVVANLAHSFAIQFCVMLEPGRSLPFEFHLRNFHLFWFIIYSKPLYRFTATFRFTKYISLPRYDFYYIQARFEDTFLPLV